MRNKFKKAFLLIKVSIVILVVAFVVTMIIKSKTMIEKAEMTSRSWALQQNIV
mgnify:CR=1 FL=1